MGSTTRTLRLGVGLGLLYGLVAVAIKASTRPLGATRRTSPRTGAIPVDPKIVDDRVDAVLKIFVKCDRGLKPPPFGERVAPVEVIDPGTGERRLTHIFVRTRPMEDGAGIHESVAGGARAVNRAGVIEHWVTLYPRANTCWYEATWRDELTRTLTHELAHATDPRLAMEARRGKWRPRFKDGPKYYNAPQEITAQLAEVDRQLQTELSRESSRWWDDLAPADLLRRYSSRYGELAPKLTAKNRRRFLRLAARLQETYLAQAKREDRKWDRIWKHRRVHATRRGRKLFG